jgi:hypothetical protein
MKYLWCLTIFLLCFVLAVAVYVADCSTVTYEPRICVKKFITHGYFYGDTQYHVLFRYPDGNIREVEGGWEDKAYYTFQVGDTDMQRVERIRFTHKNNKQ